MKRLLNWKLLPSFMLVIGLGLAAHMIPIQQQSPCEPGFFAQVQATIIPSVQAAGNCDNYCETHYPSCTGGNKLCGNGCYDGDWTYCAEQDDDQEEEG